MQNSELDGVVLGLDVGDVRVGVARAHSVARLPEPLLIFDRLASDVMEQLRSLADKENATAFVIGLPVCKSGQEGAQAKITRSFAEQLKLVAPIPQIFIDETFTSAEADEYKKMRLWRHESSNDALAACLILKRYFAEGGTSIEGSHV